PIFFLNWPAHPSVMCARITCSYMHPDEPQLLQQGFVLSSALPSAYHAMVLQGGAVRHVQDDSGGWTFQRLDEADFSLRFHVFNILRPMDFLALQGSEALV